MGCSMLDLLLTGMVGDRDDEYQTKSGSNIVCKHKSLCAACVLMDRGHSAAQQTRPLCSTFPSSTLCQHELFNLSDEYALST